ncbi:MAG: T9SS type A sorting domain-containing protein [Bacteroidota bacterium]
MIKHIYICLMIVTGFIFISATVTAQEFPIAAGRDSTFCGGAAFDGINYLVTLQGDTVNPNSITAQLVSASGSLVGSRISLGMSGGSPLAAFDGSNYLMAWYDNSNTVYGQFINTFGNLVGSHFVIANNATFGNGGWRLAFGDSAYMVVLTRDTILYGQLVGKSGNLIGAAAQISANSAGDNAIAFDGTNFLVAWCDNSSNNRDALGRPKDIYGQFISKSGVLIGSNFLIDDGPYASDNPVTIAFDGSRYMVCFHDQAKLVSHKWNLFARFVTPSGTVAEKVTIRDSTYNPIFPAIAFDGTSYLITWTENVLSLDSAQSKGMFFNTSGIPIDTAFTLFGTLGSKIPLFAGPIFGGGEYLVVTTRVILNISPDGHIDFTNGDVYGKIIQTTTTGIKENQVNQIPKEFSLSQNYPNPFNPATTISFNLPIKSFVTLKMFDIMGREVATIVSEELSAGSYSRSWNAANISSGIYFYRIQTGSFTETKKLILLR